MSPTSGASEPKAGLPFAQPNSERWVADAADPAGQIAYLEQAFQLPFMQQVAKSGLALLNLKPGESVLEAGCGSGVFLPLLAKAVGHTGRVIGIDHAAPLVEEANERIAQYHLNPHVSAVLGDLTALDFPNNSFDAAHVERVLMHLEFPDRALAELMRVVKPGGWVVAAEPDWGGSRIDHTSRDDFDILTMHLMQVRHQDMGLTLHRRFKALGAVDIVSAPVVGVFTDLAVLRAFGINFNLTVDHVVEQGLLSRERAAEAVVQLEQADRLGQIYSVGIFHVVAARVG